MTEPLAAVREITGQFAHAGTTSPAAEATTLVAWACDVDPRQLLLAGPLSTTQAQRLDEAVARRLAGTPVQHLTGTAWFRTVRLDVGPGVFVPRPETEVMTGWAVDWLSTRPGPATVVELCAGSGAISAAIAAEAPGHQQWAVELSPEAMPYLQANLRGTGVVALEADMATAVPELNGAVDLVIVNPPYIPLTAWESVPADVRDHDPALALWSGDDGLDAIGVVTQVAGRLLRPGGVVACEHADAQAEAAPAVFVRSGLFDQVRDHRDLSGRARFVTAVRVDNGRMAQ